MTKLPRMVLDLELLDADIRMFRIELKLIVAGVYTNYRSRVIDDQGIEQEDAYSAGPKGSKLILEFERAW
jgi:hypothetical protein